jgi:hypothetical protein
MRDTARRETSNSLCAVCNTLAEVLIEIAVKHDAQMAHCMAVSAHVHVWSDKIVADVE